MLVRYILLSSLYIIIQAVDTNVLANVATALDRLNLLSDDDFVFDFNTATTRTVGLAGRTVAADSDTFPALIGNGVGMTLGFLGPCGMNTPHIHPRASELNININSTSLVSGVFNENGGRFIAHELLPLQATIFPQGAIHFEMNTGCEPALFVAAFGNPDPGVTQLAQGLLQKLPTDVVKAIIGDSSGSIDLPELAKHIPGNVAFGVDSCLQRCGLMPPPTNVNVSAPASFEDAARSPSKFVAGTVAVKQPVGVNTDDLDHASTSKQFVVPQDTLSSFNDGLKPYFIAAMSVNAFLVLLIVAYALFSFLQHRKTVSNRSQSAIYSDPRFDSFKDPYDSNLLTPSPAPSSKPV